MQRNSANIVTELKKDYFISYLKILNIPLQILKKYCQIFGLFHG